MWIDISLPVSCTVGTIRAVVLLEAVKHCEEVAPAGCLKTEACGDDNYNQLRARIWGLELEQRLEVHPTVIITLHAFAWCSTVSACYAALLCVWVNEVLHVHPSRPQASSPAMSSYEAWQRVYLGCHFLDVSAWFGTDYQLMAGGFIELAAQLQRWRGKIRDKGKKTENKPERTQEEKLVALKPRTFILDWVFVYITLSLLL